MRASIQDVTRVIKSKGTPQTITQEPFEYGSGHYRRLCSAQLDEIDPSDLVNYAMDMEYMELQPELLRFLTPLLLKAWRRDLFEGDAARLGGFVEQFWPALLKGVALKKVFSEAERAAFIGYLRDSILDRLDDENSLQFSGMGASPYRWVQSLVSYGVLFDIDTLWTEWWQTKTPGHAIAVFQYASALMYEDEKNPVFSPWTRDKGGGAPSLSEPYGFLFDVGWTDQNITFVETTLSVDYIAERLGIAVDRIPIGPVKEMALRLVRDLPEQGALLELRIEELPNLLKNVSAIEGFTI